ncbi:MAG TPA: cytochrome C oxidase subunit IV family protein [Planctomycetota bacterium]|nr:cytochrome C oxidase subunit IV family protein [Planctomycetota bacterium]
MSAHASSHAEHVEGMHVAHVSSAGTLVRVLIALLFLTVITVAVSRVDFGSANLLVAMLIALVKMSLVMTWFMHLKHDTAVNTLFILGSFVFLALLFLFTISDHVTRGDVDQTLTQPAPVMPGTYPSSLKGDH